MYVDVLLVKVPEFSESLDTSGFPWNSIIGFDMPSALGLVAISFQIK